MTVERKVKRKYYKPTYNGYAYRFKPTGAIQVLKGPHREELKKDIASNPLLAMIKAHQNFKNLMAVPGGRTITEALKYK